MTMPGDPIAAGAVPQPGPAPTPPSQVKPERVVSEQDEALAKDYLKRIEAAKARPAFSKFMETAKRNRQLLRGVDPSLPEKHQRMRTNLHYSNMVMTRVQVYAKDPEYSVRPSEGVEEGKLEATKALADTCEAVLQAELVKGCSLKKRAKRLLTSTFTTSVGWWKLIFQEDKRTDPLIANQIKDTQDNLMRIQAMRDQLHDPAAGTDLDKQLAQLNQTLQGLRAQSEISIGRGLALDFVLPEDLLVLDESIRELADYPRSSALAHRVWMTRRMMRTRWGFAPKGGKIFSDVKGTEASTANANRVSDDDLFEVFEVWDQDAGRVLHVATGEKGFLDAPSSPDWTPERWYPFFCLLFNETDGDLFPLSDIEMTELLVREYNEARDDLVKDRRDARPVTLVRKGGSLTEKDVTNVRNRQGNDIILVEGIGGQPIQNDIVALTFGQINPQVYNTQPARADIEQIIGGGDAARGSVLEAKTATEAEILSQGLRGRSAERQDIMEDLLTEVGTAALQICLRKLTPEEVQKIAGANAQWPAMAPIDDIFRMVTLDVRGGSTGKPDRLQDQDRWTKLLPVIEKTIEQVSELRAKGQDQLAEALITLTRETLRRFDERLDIEQFLPPKDAKTGADPAQLAAENQQLKQQLQEQNVEKAKQALEQEKAEMATAVALATAPAPAIALQAYQIAMQIIEAQEQGEGTGQPPGAVQGGLMAQLQQMLGGAQQPPGAPDAGPPQPGPADAPTLPIPQPPAQTGAPDQPQP